MKLSFNDIASAANSAAAAAATAAVASSAAAAATAASESAATSANATTATDMAASVLGIELHLLPKRVSCTWARRYRLRAKRW